MTCIHTHVTRKIYNVVHVDMYIVRIMFGHLEDVWGEFVNNRRSLQVLKAQHPVSFHTLVSSPDPHPHVGKGQLVAFEGFLGLSVNLEQATMQSMCNFQGIRSACGWGLGMRLFTHVLTLVLILLPFMYNLQFVVIYIQVQNVN